MKRRDNVQRMLGMQLVLLADQPAVPGDPSLQVLIVGRVEPDDPSPQQNPVMASLAVSALPDFLGPVDGRVEVGHHLGVGHFGDDFGENLPEFGELRDVPLARIKLRGDGKVPQLGQPAADVLDVLVNAEDLLHDEDHREGPPEAGIAR